MAWLICIHIHHFFAARGLQVETIAAWGFLYAAFCFHKLQGHKHMLDQMSAFDLRNAKCTFEEDRRWARNSGRAFYKCFWPQIIKHRSFVMEHKSILGHSNFEKQHDMNLFSVQVCMRLSHGVPDFWDIPKFVDQHESYEGCMKLFELGKPGIPSNSFHDAPPIVEVLSSRNSSLSICFSNFDFQGLSKYRCCHKDRFSQVRWASLVFEDMGLVRNW